MSKEKIKSLQGLRMLLFCSIFFFHTGMYVGEKTIYHLIFAGGGTQAVAYFFILSGFVAALSGSGNAVEPKNYVQYITNKVKRFYPYHIVFFILALPVDYYMILHSPLKAFFLAVINVLLLQSWFPDNSIWLSYNSVAWFLSTLIFLSCFTPLLVWIDHRIKKISSIYTKRILLFGIIFVCGVIQITLALKISVNYEYWLYAFPPVRLLDYTAGFFLGKLFCEEKKKNFFGQKGATILETIAMLIYMGTLCYYPNCNEMITRAALYFPGALIMIWTFGKSRGLISKLFSANWLVNLGNRTLYYMMSHQIILRYVEKIYSRLPFKLNGMEWICVFMALLLTIFSEPIFSSILKKFQGINTRIKEK